MVRREKVCMPGWVNMLNDGPDSLKRLLEYHTHAHKLPCCTEISSRLAGLVQEREGERVSCMERPLTGACLVRGWWQEDECQAWGTWSKWVKEEKSGSHKDIHHLCSAEQPLSPHERGNPIPGIPHPCHWLVSGLSLWML